MSSKAKLLWHLRLLLHDSRFSCVLPELRPIELLLSHSVSTRENADHLHCVHEGGGWHEEQWQILLCHLQQLGSQVAWFARHFELFK